MMSIKEKKRHIQPTHPKLSIQRQCEFIDLPRFDEQIPAEVYYGENQLRLVG